MTTPKLGPIFQLSEQEVEDVIQDVKDAESGVRIFYTVDSHEVIDYCFPISLDDMRPIDTDLIADDQAALYDIFYARPSRPILIPEYGKELKRHVTYLRMRQDEVFNLLDEIEALKGNQDLDNVSSSSREEIVEKMQEQFNNLLAVVMRIHSTGIERLLSVTQRRLQRIDTMDDPLIRRAAESYVASPLAEEIFRELTQEKDGGRWTEAEIYRKTRAAETDAKAVDWLIHMNGFLRREGETKYRILYLSSATKTRRIFNLPVVRRAIERQFKINTPLYRSRAQILAGIVSAASATDRKERSAHTLDNKESSFEPMRQIASDLCLLRERRAEGCDRCVLQDGKPEDCAYRSVCETIKQVNKRRKEIQNLGLISQIQNYQHLLENKPQPKNKNHQEYIASFQQMLSLQNLGDIAIARMQAALSIKLTQAQLTLPLGEDLPEKPLEAKRSAQFVSLPVAPKVENPVYGEIIRKIFEYPDLKLIDETAADAMLHEAILEFHSLDGDRSETSAEHELVRCLIYMTEFETDRDATRGDENAFVYAQKMVEARPDLKAEFLYVMLWTARRLKKFIDANSAAQAAIALRPDDPRFFHGRSLNTLVWLEDEDERWRIICPWKIADAINDARRALQLYEEQPEDRTTCKATQWNNIAWMYASADPGGKDYKLSAAREALDQMKQVMPRESWLPGFPAFFHTEAFIEFEEFKRDRQGGDRAAQQARLKLAEDAIERALGARTNTIYTQLRDQIKAELHKIARQQARAGTQVDTRLAAT